MSLQTKYILFKSNILRMIAFVNIWYFFISHPSFLAGHAIFLNTLYLNLQIL